MGLASKLASAQAAYPGGPPASGGPPGAYPNQQPQQYSAYPGGPPKAGAPSGQQQQGYGGAPQQGQQQQGQYGAPPPQVHQQQGQYGAPPPQGGGNPNAFKNMLQATIQEKGLQNFYPPGHPLLDQIANRASQQVAHLAQTWRINPEIANDIVKLALYDVILYIDDSGSMAFEENGERIDDLKVILTRVAFATGLFDEDGIQVRFMNSTMQGNGIKSDAQVNDMISKTKFSGMTPMGRELQAKILGPLVLGPARSGGLRKPVLVITITDGQPTGESPADIAKIIRNASQELQSNPRLGKGALAFQFAQVGNDLKAREFLGKLDEEPGIGDVIDCTSNYEVEADEMKQANPPVDLTPELWLIKLLLGSIDSSYDTKDEKNTGSRPPQGNYGAPQQQQYGGGYGAPPPQQGGYGAPPPQQGGYGGQQQQGGYGQRPPQQQQGGYGQQQGGYPPQQQGGYGSQQGGYGGQQGGGYGSQQGGYGAPPPPRY